MDAQNRAVEDGQKPTAGLLRGRCPLCPLDTPTWVTVARDFQPPGPSSFFVEIKPSADSKTAMYSATPSIGVRAYGEPYVLDTVIYKHSGGHFTCQTRLGGKCFWTFDDLDPSGEVTPQHHFNPSYADGDGSPHLLLYVRQPTPESATDMHTYFVEREASLSQYRQLQVMVAATSYTKGSRVCACSTTQSRMNVLHTALHSLPRRPFVMNSGVMRTGRACELEGARTRGDTVQVSVRLGSGPRDRRRGYPWRERSKKTTRQGSDSGCER